MENVKVNFTNKLGVTSVVTMPVNQFVASQDLHPKHYSLFIEPDLTAEGAIDSAAILKEYLESIVPVEVYQSETDMETIAALQAQVADLQSQVTSLKAQLAAAATAAKEIPAAQE